MTLVQVQQTMADADRRPGRLTQWESTFLSSIKAQIIRGVDLTEAQTDKLNQIEYKLYGD